MKITYITTKRPVTTLMFFVAIVLLGFVSLRELSVDLLPNISYPRLSVVTQYQGVAPEEIETIITDDLEAAVSRIPGLRRVESISKEGVSYMTLEFAWGTDMDFAMLHIHANGFQGQTFAAGIHVQCHNGATGQRGGKQIIW